MGHDSGFRASVDLHERSLPRDFYAPRELDRQRRRGGDHAIERRQLYRRFREHFQVRWRGYQHARSRHGSQRAAHVGGIEGFVVVRKTLRGEGAQQ